ncbi:M56 family metallopeptidase [Streptomyces sp. JV185]|uniref:M48 family metallopeptidase n=1 Tax=Streptomyces sp. JV185 TaxID=858638 RepID=UPI002E76BE6A|nr:M56 family metallopeptidase [Streptomyces sp. JV185]MEE1768559.1 M56 family metallopeptidase [Streptomyces sp. JV185]
MAAMGSSDSRGGGAVGAGTTVRFVLLAVLVLVTSGLMLLYMAFWWLSGADSYSCDLAAGVDIDHMSDLQLLITRSTQWVAYRSCQLRHAQPPSWWVPVLWLALLAVAAVVLFFWLPVWKARRGRVVPLASVDHDRAIHGVLEEVAAVAGVTRLPRVVVDPAAASVGAVVFGRNGRPVLCLYGGLLALGARDAAGFRAVLLHEFAHLRNGDVTLTYATVALWRVFLFLVAPPYLVGVVMYLVREMQSGNSLWAVPSRSILQFLFFVALMYLARSDVLRSREIHADRAAVRWGADSGGWQVSAPPAPEGVLRRRLAPFAALWRPHPRWDLRRGALTDSGPVYAVPALPMFLTGAAAILINSQLALALRPYLQSPGALISQAVALAAAGLVAGVVGVTLWRAVIHAVLTGRRPPSGLRAGLWLGAGMAAGTLTAGQGTIEQFFPSRNALLLLFLLGGPAFTWWTAQVARLWVTTWRGRTIRPALVASLVAGGLALAQWFTWWHGSATAVATGWWYDTEGIRQRLEQSYPGPAADHPTMLSGIGAVFPMVLNTNALPLSAAAIAALWTVPLAAWIPRPIPAVRPWTRHAAADIEGAVEPPALSPPRLGGALLAGLSCGVGCWVVVVAALAYPGAGLAGAPARGASLQGLLFLAWTYLALTVSAVTAGAIASVRAHRHRLLVTLIAAQIAFVVGSAGPLMLLLSDGCVDELTLFRRSSCAWRPALLTDWLDLHVTWDFALMTVTVAAIAVAAVVSVVRGAHVPRPPRQRAAGPRRRGGAACRRGLLVVVCVVALTVSVAESAYRQDRIPPEVTDFRALQEEFRQVSPRLAAGAVAPLTRARQVTAWNDLEGKELLDGFRRERDRLLTIERTFVERKKSPAYLFGLRPVCEGIGRTAVDAHAYFRIPDAQGQVLWEQFILDAANSTLECRKALDHLKAHRYKQAGATFVTSFEKVDAAYRSSNAIDSRIDRIRRAGGL